MRCTQDVYIAGTGSWIASHAQPLRPMIDQGRVGEAHRSLGYESVAIDRTGTAAPDMAIGAAQTAVKRAGVGPDEFGLHLHACLWFQGLDYWSAANYIAYNSIGRTAVPFCVDQRSCGGLGAVHLGAAYLASGAAPAVLITTGDRYPEPNIDRWNSQTQTIYGDGAAALVLSNRTGFARLLSTVSVSENSLEGYSRGTNPFAELPGQEIPIKVHSRYEQQTAIADSEADWGRWGAALMSARDRALADAGLQVGDIKRLVTPFVHRGEGQTEVHDVLGFAESQTLWPEFGRYVGHLGAGDQIAGLNYLVEHGAVQPGDRVMLFAVGMGFNFSAAVVEITEMPAW